jgi:ABC-type amino acid transport substrate-binding protein
MSQKRIALDVKEGPSGLVVVVTAPTPWGTVKTFDVDVSDEFAAALIAKVETLLAARHRMRLPPGAWEAKP